jgi:peptidylprolyl isomerase
MSQAKSGDTVKVHYTGTLRDGTLFDSSRERDPLEFTLGEGNTIPGFENALVGMALGESKTVVIAPEHAYGERNEDAVQEFPREMMPAELELEIGVRLKAQAPDGQPMVLTVAAFDDETVSLDANHPLAGEELTFEVELIEIG